MNHPKTLAHHQTIRDDFPVLRDTIYLNVGTYGVMPQPALDHLLAVLGQFEQHGVASAGDLKLEIQKTREKVAELLHCDSEQITFVGNATDGTNLVLSGLPWQSGDEVITTDEEHESIIHPLLYLQQVRGLRMRRVGASHDPKVMISRLESVISPRTKLVAFSHVTCETGRRLPARIICDWARERGILSLVDGAQSLGVFATSVGDLACDFYTSNGHKWLGGPKGTGIFYASPERMLSLCPANVGAGSLEHANVEDGTAILWRTGRRFEFGTRASALFAGLGASLRWLEALGWANIERHIAAMGGYLKGKIMERPFLRLLTPVAFAESSGLTTFSIEGWPAGEVSLLLRRNSGIHVRVIPHYNAIRISTPCFCGEQDIDTLMDGLESIYRQPRKHDA